MILFIPVTISRIEREGNVRALRASQLEWMKVRGRATEGEAIAGILPYLLQKHLTLVLLEGKAYLHNCQGYGKVWYYVQIDLAVFESIKGCRNICERWRFYTESDYVISCGEDCYYMTMGKGYNQVKADVKKNNSFLWY